MREEDKAAMEAMMGMDDDVDLDDAGQEKEVVVKKEREESGGITRKGGKEKTKPGERKRRKVKKSVQEVNEKGYMGELTYARYPMVVLTMTFPSTQADEKNNSH